MLSSSPHNYSSHPLPVSLLIYIPIHDNEEAPKCNLFPLRVCVCVLCVLHPEFFLFYCSSAAACLSAKQWIHDRTHRNVSFVVLFRVPSSVCCSTVFIWLIIFLHLFTFLIRYLVFSELFLLIAFVLLAAGSTLG